VEGDFWVVLLGFLEGGWENVMFFDGEFVVSLWWINGELWSVERTILSGENLPLF
jgi:hypothetical protein